MTLNPGVIVTEVLTGPTHGPERPLFAREILERITEMLTARFRGQKMDDRLLTEVHRVLREVLLRQAELRGISSFGIERLADRIGIMVDIPTQNILINISPETLKEIDRYLYNIHCHICGKELPGGGIHEKSDCDHHIVENVMDE